MQRNWSAHIACLSSVQQETPVDDNEVRILEWRGTTCIARELVDVKPRKQINLTMDIE